MEHLIEFGYSGEIYPVNPNTKEILGKKSYPSVRTLKDRVDLAVITTPRETTVDILKDCVAANIKAAIVVNQGFGDADGRGRKIQREMTRIAESDGIRILGPNTLGVVNTFNNFTTSFMPVVKERAPIGVISQSGLQMVAPEQFSGKVGKGIDLGNACDIGFYDALEYFGQDPDIKIIAIHMEGLSRGKEFLSLAKQVGKKKPIIVYKSGSSKTGAKAAMSHTGSMAGDYQVIASALKQAGVTFLENGGQMPHAVKTLLNLPTMRGRSVAVVTYSGGAGIMSSDGLERYNMKLASLSPETIRRVAELSPEWMPLGNPLDVWPAVMLRGADKACSEALRAVLSDPNVDGVIFIAIAPAPEFSFLDVPGVLNSVVEEFPPDKPLIAWTYGPNAGETHKQLESKMKIMTYPTLEIATWALSLLRDRHKSIERRDQR
jgi:acetyltransferase